jgi:hypothetical protein
VSTRPAWDTNGDHVSKTKYKIKEQEELFKWWSD